MNKIFKIVFNAARGKMMVVNEATSSVQTGKKAAVTVAVIGALTAGSAMAADLTEVEWAGENDIVLSKAPEQNANPQGYVYKDNLVKLGEGAYSITGPAHQWGFVQNSSFVGEKASLTLDAKLDSNNSAAAIGDRTKDITVDKLTVKSEYYGIYKGYTEPGFESVTSNIKANEVSVNSTKSALYTAIKDVTVSFTEFETLSLTSKEHAVKNNGGTIVIGDGTGDATFTSTTMGSVATIKAGATTTISAENVTVDATINDHDSEYKNSAVYLNAGAMTLEATNALTVTATKGEGTKAINGIHVTGADRVLEVVAGTATISATSKSGSAYGILTEKDGSVKLSANTTTISAGNYGIYAKSGSTAELSGTSIEISAASAGVVGWGADVTLGSKNTDNVKVNVISTDKNKADAKGIWSYDEGTMVTVQGKQLDVNVDGQGVKTVYGIYVQGDINTNSDDNGAIIIDAEKTNVEVKGGTLSNVGLCTMAEGTLIVNGDLAVTADLAIVTRGNSVIDINASGANTVQLDGDIKFDYDAQTSGTAIDSIVNLNLSNADSYLKGNITKDNEVSGIKGEVTGMTLGLSNGATWYATKDSFANVLTLNNGIVDIQGGTTVTVDTEAKGAGTIALGSDNDFFKVTGKNTLDSLTVTQAGATADTMSAAEAEATAKLYADNVVGSDGKALESTFVVAEGEVGGEIVVGADGTAEQEVNSKTEALADKVALAPEMITRIMMNDVRKRMGDLRAAVGTHGVWARYNGGQMSGSDVDADFHMVQVGIDTVPVVDAPRFGVAFSYAQAEAKDNFGTTDMDSFSLAFYGTKMYDNGMFVDVIGRMATMDSDIVNAGAKGKMDNVALSLSGELGWRFDVTDRFFFEPSVEATYTYTNADTFTMTNGGTYELEAVDSLVGRAGFAAGFKCPANKGDIYVRAAVVHEFMGDMVVNSSRNGIAAATLEADGKDTWFEYAIGANFNVNKNTYVYADIERTEGAALDEDWRANVGVRFAF